MGARAGVLVVGRGAALAVGTVEGRAVAEAGGDGDGIGGRDGRGIGDAIKAAGDGGGGLDNAAQRIPDSGVDGADGTAAH